MTKLQLGKPVIIGFYGYPGSGKSYLARNLSESMGLANVSADRIRNELFEKPRFDEQENAIVDHLMRYMSEEFLNAGVGVAYDANLSRTAQRKAIKELAQRNKAEFYLVWLQIDEESAFARTQNRDRRTLDDKFAKPQTRETFDNQTSTMQNPTSDESLVVSGKHTFTTQKSAIVSRLFQDGLVTNNDARKHMAKPGLVNLVPNLHAGRVDYTRRSINVG